MSLKSVIYTVLTGVVVFLTAACTPKPSRPVQVGELPPMYPDYTDVWIPCNIAPLNFLLRGDVEAVEVRAVGDGHEIVVNSRGGEVCFDESEWKELLRASEGKTVRVVVTALTDGQWREYKSFSWHVTTDTIDPYLTYRLIEPDYEIYQNLTLKERCLETFDERSISDYGLVGNRCMNCHTYSSQNPSLSALYVRGEGGGMILNRDGRLFKLNVKADDMVSGSVYFAFSPSGKYITFSTNVIIPAFHARPSKRLEVFDRVSDVYVDDI